jgi:hypothetical protein
VFVLLVFRNCTGYVVVGKGINEVSDKRKCSSQWSLYVPPVLTFRNSTFCPQSIFVCFVWVSEQTAITSLYSIN